MRRILSLILPIMSSICTILAIITFILSFVVKTDIKQKIFWGGISTYWIIYWIVIITLSVKEYRKQNNENE